MIVTLENNQTEIAIPESDGEHGSGHHHRQQ